MKYLFFLMLMSSNPILIWIVKYGDFGVEAKEAADDMEKAVMVAVGIAVFVALGGWIFY